MRPAAILSLGPTLLFVLLAAAAVAERPDPQIHGEYQGDPMYTLLPPDAIPAIHDPVYVTGAEADAQMSPDEPVLGLADDNDAVCWSAWQLDHHEIVNDEFAGTPIAATW